MGWEDRGVPNFVFVFEHEMAQNEPRGKEKVKILHKMAREM